MRANPVLPTIAAAAAAVLIAPACVLPDDLAQIQKDVADVRQEVVRLRVQQDGAAERLAKVEAELHGADAVGRSEFADLKVTIDDLGRRILALDDRLAQSERRIDRVAQDAQASREISRRLAVATPPSAAPSTAEPSEPAAPGGDALPSPEVLYNQAYADFSKGNFALAISGFEEYAQKFPDSDTADNALYWVGECHFSQGNYTEAVRSFDRMLEAYPKSEKAPAADLKKGLAFLESNRIREAIVQLRYVTQSYPGTDEARIAGERLAALGSP